MKYHILLSLILITFITSQKTSLDLDLSIGETICLQESIPAKTVAYFEVSSRSKDIFSQIKAQDGMTIMKKKTDEFKHTFTTDNPGYFELCITNQDRHKTSSVTIIIKHGVALKDYSSLARSKDLKPIDLELKKISDQEPLLKYYQRMAQRYEGQFDNILNSISSKVVFYSVILMIVMVAVGFTETFYLKKFMEKRKLI